MKVKSLTKLELRTLHQKEIASFFGGRRLSPEEEVVLTVYTGRMYGAPVEDFWLRVDRYWAYRERGNDLVAKKPAENASDAISFLRALRAHMRLVAKGDERCIMAGKPLEWKFGSDGEIIAV